MNQELSVLIVGCGAIAGGYDAERPTRPGPLTHAGAFRRHGGFRIAGCVEPDRERGEAFAQRWSVEKAYRDIEEIGSSEQIDIVSICSPSALHGEHLQAALCLHPRLIFCEKPMTLDMVQTRRMLAACDSANVLLAVNYTRRWAPDVVRLGRELCSGAWGVVRAANGVYNKGVLNNGSHMVDLLRLLLGPLRLVAAGDPVWDYLDNDPTVPTILSTAAGAPVVLGTAHAADYSLFELSIVTERDVICMEDGGSNWRMRRSVDSPTFPGYKALDPGEWRKGEYDQAMLAAVTEIHDAVSFGRPLSSTGSSAAATQELCTAIRDAALARTNRGGIARHD